MSTRAGVIIKDGHDELHFYRHSDGYPEGTLPTLEKFLNLVKEGKIRNNVDQAAGWLIIIGAEEYNKYSGFKCSKCGKTEMNGLKTVFVTDKSEEENGSYCKECEVKAPYVNEPLPAEIALKPDGRYGFANWKVGAYEPTKDVYRHGDLEYVYLIDLVKLKITYKEA